MNWDDYRRRFEAEARSQGRSAEFIGRALSSAENLVRQGLPVIFDSDHLIRVLGFDPMRLRKLLESASDLYKTYYIPKRVGGYRKIDEPLPLLRRIQVWILRNILDFCAPSEIAMAFVKHRSIKDNAAIHLGGPMVLSLDVRDFFPTASAVHVDSVFCDLGFSRSVVDALVSMTVLENRLPQGSPTSPALSNLILRQFDARLIGVAKKFGVRCSRYADDITVSGLFRVSDIISEVRFLLAEYGFVLNESKTRLMLPHERQEVTGVVVNRYLQAPRGIRRALRQEIYYIQKYGMEAHERWRGSAYPNRQAYLRGLAEYVLFLNPNDRDARQVVQALGRVQYKQT